MNREKSIAVVGMDGIFPGAATLERFWHNIVNGIDQSKPVPEARWIAPLADRLSKSLVPDRTYSPCACLIDDFSFDPDGFRLSPDLTRHLDPVHQLTLTAGKRALDGCVVHPVDPDRVDTILAAIALPTDSASRFSRELFGRVIESRLFPRVTVAPTKFSRIEALASRVDGLPAALLAAEMGFGGNSFTLDAACASSIYAVRLACNALTAKRADMVVTGGVSRPECLYTQTGFSQLQALSPSGRCAPFDRRADGLVVGEGVGILVLKRLDDALEHGDRIHGIIRGIGLSNDMRGNLLAPEQSGQVRAMRMAYQAAGWRPSDVDLIECHGTGTRAGDTTEIASLMELWQTEENRRGTCAIGSVKSMIGHLLTAAGAAGMIKALLALQHRTLPPSIHFDQAPPDSPLPDSPFRVQRTAQPWPAREAATPRRAAISAFGFGGINAHLLVEEYLPSSRPENATDRRTITIHAKNVEARPEPVAIVGMDVRVGPLTGLDVFEEAVFKGKTAIGKRPDNRWKGADAMVVGALDGIDPHGAYMSQIDLAIGDFQIPPNEIDAILPQQLLALQTGAGALADAGMALREARERMGTVIGIGFDFEATNFHLRWQLAPLLVRLNRTHGLRLDPNDLAGWLESVRDACGPPLTAPRVMGALGGIVASRVAREFRFGGPSFVVSADSASGIKALETAVHLLQSKVADTMLVGAVDLFAESRSVVRMQQFLPLSPENRIRPFDAGADGTLPGDGAVAMVLKPLDRARTDGDRIYAVINGIGSAGGDDPATGRISQATLHRSLEHCLSPHGRTADAPGYIEVQGIGEPKRDGLERDALAAYFIPMVDHDAAAAIAIGAATPVTGYAGAADGLISVAKTALCLYRRLLPPLVGYSGPADDAGKRLPFHMPRQTEPWYRDHERGPRRAVSSTVTLDGTCAHVLLEEDDRPECPPPSLSTPACRNAGSALFVVTGDSPDALVHGIDRLAAHLRSSLSQTGIDAAAARWFRHQPPAARERLAVALVIGAGDDIGRVLHRARQTVTAGSEPEPASGQVFHRPRPLGTDGRIAMVYPGSGNHYLGMGRELALRFPDVLAAMDRDTARLKTQQRPWVLMPWRCDWPAGWERSAMDAFTGDVLNMIFAQVVYGDLMTRVLKRFALTADAVIGYSLGESAALFAHGVWADRGDMLTRMQATDLFTDQIAGPCRSLRQAWQLPDSEPVDWQVAVVNRPADQVRAAIAGMAHVRLLIVNTPEECVIGGLAPAVGRVINRLGCQAVFLDGVVTVHCDAALPVADAYRDLHYFPTTPKGGLTVYSCSNVEPYAVTADSAADSIKKQAVEGFDFTRTIKRAHDDGIRIFVETGPRGSCTRMIDRILHDRPHLAVAANQGGENEYTALLRCLARLVAERVPLDISGLYAGVDVEPMATVNTDRPVVTVDVGGERLISDPPPLPTPGRPEALTVDANNEPDTTDEKAPPTRPSPSVGAPDDLFGALIEGATDNMAATAEAHERFLRLSQTLTRQYAEAFDLQNRLLADGAMTGPDERTAFVPPETPAPREPADAAPATEPRQVAFDRDQCMAFAVGRVGHVLGPAFDVVDTYRVRVRLPDEPLMLVDRILSVDGDMLSMTRGRVVTEHDVRPGAWYLDGDRAPVCISVEAGQADLFLSAYLGIDHQVKGERAYRLLDAVVTFHRGLPRPGETIRYDIAIDRFVRQGETWMFFFRFEGFIGDEHLISMRDGCAGFFTEAEVNRSGGIILTPAEREPVAGKSPKAWHPPVPMDRESYSDSQVDALRRGDLAGCFGERFAGVTLAPSLWMPDGRMRLIHRVLELDPTGGRYGLGMIRAEADIQPDDWFLTCHFVDDMVMPGTLMYECCAHTLRVFMQRMGWVTDRPGACYEPVIGNAARLKCRGPVTPKTRHVHYEIQISEIGYGPEPFVIADAHMSADGRPIVFFKDMSMKMSGVDRQTIESTWVSTPVRRSGEADAPLYDRDSILAFAVGNPSEAFGEPYRVFDSERLIARLPGPPYCFMDRVIRVEPPAWQVVADGWVTAEYDIPPQAWYFAADRSGVMPFCVLLEIALQPCGWLAAYAGSALRSRQDLKFRNLGGNAVLHRQVHPDDGRLTMRCRMTKVSEAAEMLIENFDFEVIAGNHPVYTGDTYFGFFSKTALAQQKGLGKADPLVSSLTAFKDAAIGKVDLEMTAPLTPDAADGRPLAVDGLDLPGKALLMIDGIDAYDPVGGSQGLGYIRGSKRVDPDEWFFKAHFYQDPVCPGSLGLESFLQLLKFVAMNRWPQLAATHRFRLSTGSRHRWSYRGQIIPPNRRVTVEASISHVNEDADSPSLRADGLLQVDGLPIYKMEDFELALVPAVKGKRP